MEAATVKIDSHQHFWHFDPVAHAWMSDQMGALRRDYLPGELAPLLGAIGFDGTVVVQARQSLEETRWLLELAGEHEFIRGVVGWVDLRSPELDAQLAEFAGQPKFVGVRHVVHDEPDDGVLLREDFRQGIGRLREFGLTYDLLLFPKHLAAAAALAAEFPAQPFVLDHLGKPDIKGGVLDPWEDEIRALARHPNVHCKLSGMVTEAAWATWRAEDFRPYLDVVFAAFGPERLMIGSDWPVCLLAGNYASVMQLVTDRVAALPEPERAAILGGNCARFYGLPPAATAG
jgi:L-fuconolactonase